MNCGRNVSKKLNSAIIMTRKTISKEYPPKKKETLNTTFNKCFCYNPESIAFMSRSNVTGLLKRHGQPFNC